MTSQLSLKILVYKRTHEGDPGPDGCFGVYDCMGSVRDRDYDAVIGVGGIGGEAQSCGIAGTVNWIGIGPHKRQVDGKHGPGQTSSRKANGPRLKLIYGSSSAPTLRQSRLLGEIGKAENIAL